MGSFWWRIVSHKGGLGGYISGYMELEAGQKLYFYI